jgi:glutathione synthase/RimK-type ligase-like ATP-grasp enzyme
MSLTDKCLLIISSFFEPNVNHVIKELEKRGVGWRRFNTESFPLLCRGRIHFSGNDERPHFRLSMNGEVIDSHEVGAVWYRRQSDPVLAKSLRQEDRDFVRLECLGYLNTLYRCLDHCRWVNPWLSERLAGDKTKQLSIARSVGLAVPRTLVTNDPQAVRGFFQQCAGRVIFKPLIGQVTGRPPDFSTQLQASFEDQFAFPPACGLEPSQQDRRVVFTQLLSQDRLDEIDALAACPAIFQEYVDKQVELRITIVGAKLFAAAIHSQEYPETSVDFRRWALLPPEKDVKHAVFNLPSVVQTKLLALMDRLGLVFGCADLILTPAGEYVFLEVNPSGQWGWIEDKTGMPITSALVDLLIGGESNSKSQEPNSSGRSS